MQSYKLAVSIRKNCHSELDLSIKRAKFEWLNYAMGCSVSIYLTFGTCPTFAQSVPNVATPAICDVNLTLLKATEIGTDPNIVTANTVSPQATTVPSLWWTNEQFPGKLVTNWIANSRQRQVYLLVNTQYWNILDYTDRYGTISKFGRVAQGYGYNLTICNTQKLALGSYICEPTSGEPNSSQNSPSTAPRQSCQIWLNGNEQNGIGIQRK
ncbi:hypothetical protein [Chamaesiphon sp. GL140_3_metabinner_50]|uniref:hypothetical protein n=1 Tax=Chamaesiphon sp. GL140_3_metabinner_50 TaxID=2970812 RepID=UPI0025E548C3|nr:hypothetical protein [Chamaesiphon sp. GL140_3_metabinner_50]